jgi:hypothetical protein
MTLDLIDVYQCHWPQKNSPKISTHNLSFEVCMQFFILYDEYCFITNILHMLKFTNVYWSLFWIDCLKSKSNPIYFKQKIKIQDVIFILTQKNQMHKCSIRDYNFWGGIIWFYPFEL